MSAVYLQQNYNTSTLLVQISRTVIVLFVYLVILTQSTNKIRFRLSKLTTRKLTNNAIYKRINNRGRIYYVVKKYLIGRTLWKSVRDTWRAVDQSRFGSFTLVCNIVQYHSIVVVRSRPGCDPAVSVNTKTTKRHTQTRAQTHTHTPIPINTINECSNAAFMRKCVWMCAKPLLALIA